MSGLSASSAPLLSILLLLALCGGSCHAQLTISPSNSSACVGSTITLTCHHPELANNPATSRYIVSTPSWNEDGVLISFNAMARYQAALSDDSMSSTLAITITLEGRSAGAPSPYYDCFLVLAGGQLDKSGNASVEILSVEAVGLSTVSSSTGSELYLQWSPSQCASGYRLSWHLPQQAEVVFTTTATNRTLSAPSLGGVYTVEVAAVDGEGQMGPTTSEQVKTGSPAPSHSGSPPCKDQALVLRCQPSGLYEDRRTGYAWTVDSAPISAADSAPYALAGDSLTVANATGLEGQDVTCAEVLDTGTAIFGAPYTVETLAQPRDFTVSVQPTSPTTVTLSWQVDSYCFESETFTLTVTWNEIGNATTAVAMTTESSYVVTGLCPNTAYQLVASAEGSSGVQTEDRSLTALTELSSPVLTSASSQESSITVEWLAVNCSRSYNVSWQCVEPSSTESKITTSTDITVPVNGSAECMVHVVAIDAEGFAGPNTAAAVYPGFPRPANASSSTLSCTNRSLLLTCQFGGGEYTDIQWNSSRGPVDSSRGPLLTIDDASTLQQGTEFWCSGVSVGGTATFRVTGESYVYNESLTCVTTPPSSGGDSAAAGAAVIAGGSIGGVLVAVIVFIAGGVSGVLAQVLYRKVTAKKSAAPPSSPPAPSYGHTQGDIGAGPEMTDNPSYQLVERSQDSKQLYQNV